MSLRINSNPAAVNAYRNLTSTNVGLGKSLEKLSSGDVIKVAEVVRDLTRREGGRLFARRVAFLHHAAQRRLHRVEPGFKLAPPGFRGQEPGLHVGDFREGQGKALLRLGRLAQAPPGNQAPAGPLETIPPIRPGFRLGQRETNNSTDHALQMIDVRTD